MSSYSARQHRSMVFVVLLFALASVAAVLIKAPEEILGIKGMVILAVGAGSAAAALGNKQISIAIKRIFHSLSKRVFREREILKFYGIERLEISNDIITARLTNDKEIAYALLRVVPFPFPFQNLHEDAKERYHDGWLRTLQGIDFPCLLRVSSRAFDSSSFSASVQQAIDRGTSQNAKERLMKIMEEVRKCSEASHEKAFFIIVLSDEKGSKAHDELRSRTNTLSSLFRVNLGLESERLIGRELVAEMQRTLNPLQSGSYRDSLTVDDNKFFGVEKLVLEGDRIVAEGGSGVAIHRFLKVKEYPSDLNFDWLPRMLDTVSQPYELTIEIHPIDVYKAVQTLDNEIRTLKVEAKALELSKKVPPQSMLEIIDRLTKIQRSIVGGSEKPFRMELFLRTFTQSNGEAGLPVSRREQSVIKGVLQGNGFLMQSATADNIRYLARKTFAIPTSPREDSDKITLSTYLAKIFPYGCSTFLSSEVTANGVWIGQVLPSNQPFFLDLRSQLSYGIFVIGHLGSGKTTFNKTMAIRSNLMGEGTLVLDPSGEYVDYGRQNGVVLTFGYDQSGPGTIGINLLGVYGIPLPERKRQVKELFTRLFTLPDFSQILLGEALNEVYRMKGLLNDRPDTWTLEPPTTSDLLQVVIRNKLGAQRQNDSMKRIAWESLETRVRELTREGSYPFLDGHGNFSNEMLENKFVVANLKPLESDFGKRFIGLTLLQIVRGQFGKIPTRWNIAIEEAHLFVDAGVLIPLSKATRKFNAGLWIITQDLADIGADYRALLNDTAVKVIFRIDPTAAAEVARTYRLPKYLVEEATRLPKGHALVKLTNVPTWIQVRVVPEQVEPIDQRKSTTAQSFPITPMREAETKVTVSRLTGGNATYAFGADVKNPRHEAIVAEVCRFLKERGIEYECVRTREADICLTLGISRIAIEVETGTHGPSKVQEKIDRFTTQFDRVFILADSPTKLRYSKQLDLKNGSRLVNRREFVREINALKEVSVQR